MKNDIYILESNAWSYLANEDSWWRHQMETFVAILAVCAGNSLVTGEFPSQRPVTGMTFSLIRAWINSWVDNSEAGDLRRRHAHYDVTVIQAILQLHLSDQQVHCLLSRDLY